MFSNWRKKNKPDNICPKCGYFCHKNELVQWHCKRCRSYYETAIISDEPKFRLVNNEIIKNKENMKKWL